MLKDFRTTLQITLDSFAQWLRTQRTVNALRAVTGASETRAHRIVARWHDKSINPTQAIRALAITGNYRQAVAAGKLSPQDFAEWCERKTA